MPSFQYKARGPRGDAIEGVIEASSTDLAASRLIEGGLTPVDIQPAKQAVGMSTDLADIFPPKVELVDLIQTQPFSALAATVRYAAFAPFPFSKPRWVTLRDRPIKIKQCPAKKYGNKPIPDGHYVLQRMHKQVLKTRRGESRRIRRIRKTWITFPLE